MFGVSRPHAMDRCGCALQARIAFYVLIHLDSFVCVYMHKEPNIVGSVHVSHGLECD